LDVAAKSRTTVCIAHRLSTIRNADNIIVISRGEVVEQGTHDDLIARGGVYKGLVEAQTISTERIGAIEREIAEGDVEEEAIDEVVRVTSLQSSDEGVPLEKVKTLRTVTSDEAVKGFITAGTVPETNYSNFELLKKVIRDVMANYSRFDGTRENTNGLPLDGLQLSSPGESLRPRVSCLHILSRHS
jgi:ABC-type multidrug transport system ATPase subunit